MTTDTLPELPTPKYSETIRGVPCITVTEHEHLMREYAMQARAQVQGEPVAWCIEAQVDDEWVVQYPIRFTKQDIELDASRYTPETILRIRPLAFGDTTPQPAMSEPVGQVSDLFPSVRNKLHAKGFDSDAPLYTHPAPSVRADVVRDAAQEAVEELHKLNEHAIVYINDPEWTRVSDTCQKLIGSIDAAMLAAK